MSDPDLVPHVWYATLLLLPIAYLAHVLLGESNPSIGELHRPQDMGFSDGIFHFCTNGFYSHEGNATWAWNINIVGVIMYFQVFVPRIILTIFWSAPGWSFDYYMASWARAQPYIYGILIGYFLFKMRGKKLNIHWVTMTNESLFKCRWLFLI